MTSNPFSTRFIRPGAIPFIFPDGESLESVVERLRLQNGWGQIIGPHGSGKSTLLATLVSAMEAGGRSVVSVALRQGEHGLPSFDRSAFTSNTQLVIDGYEQLSWWSRRRVKSLCRRKGAGLLVTTHDDAGLPTIYRMNPSEALARAVVSRLVPSDDARLTPADVSAAFAATGGNLRETLFQLFDIYQRGGQ